jgi:tetratricopeptide (TPR) repeat protein
MKNLITILLGIFLILTCGAFGLNKPQTTEEPDSTSQEARALYAQNEIDSALKVLQTKGEAYRSAEDWLLIGNILQDKDKIDEATYMFKKAIDKDPKYYKAHYNLGYIYLMQDKPNMALDEFKKTVKYKNDFAYGYYNMGCAQLKLHQYRNARFNFFRAMDLKADEPMIYYNLAYSFKKLNNEKQAQKYLDLYNKMMEKE